MDGKDKNKKKPAVNAETERLWALLVKVIKRLAKHGGFQYKTVAFYWVKLNSAARHDSDFFTGLGYWTRANPEQCLLATHAANRCAERKMYGVL